MVYASYMSDRSDRSDRSDPLPSHIPVVGICGFSGSGKTTLITALLPRLTARGLRVAVIKQDAHGLAIDHEGKDTDLIFRAGADVHIRDREQAFYRAHSTPALHETLHRLAPHYDLLLVEGHKSADLPHKVWLCKPDESGPPPEATTIDLSLAWQADREGAVMELIDACLATAMAETPVYAGILIGGSSTRMGRPKHLITQDGVTWLERIVTAIRPQVERVVLLGAGDIPDSLAELPRLPDVDDGDAGGPIRGMRAAMRWAPVAGWIFAACDQPCLTGEAIAWLLAQRAPGIRAVMPQQAGVNWPEPFPAWYDFRMRPLIEAVRRPLDASTAPRTTTPVIPDYLTPAWRNINQPDNLTFTL